jgi:hypothetical protein
MRESETKMLSDVREDGSGEDDDDDGDGEHR